MMTRTSVTGRTVEELEELCESARAYSAHGERHGTLHPEVWQALRTSALPLAALPAHCGGLEWEVPRIIAAVRTVAVADASAGWVSAIHAPAGAFVARLDEVTANTVCATGDGLPPLIAGSSLPAGTTQAGADRVRLQGSWPLVTSAPQMTVAALAAPCAKDGDARWWFVPRDALHIEEDWDAFGLRGSASCSVSCDTLLPAGHTVRLTDPARMDTALYRFPLHGLMAACIAAVAHARAACAVTAFAQMTRTIRPRHTTGTLDRLGHGQSAYATASVQLVAAAQFADAAVTTAWSHALHGPVPDAERARLRAACSHLAQTSATVCQALFEAAGSAAIHRANPLESCWRDTAVAARHALVASRGWQLAGAQMLTGSAAKDL